eukprot:SRR837773.1543.p1 GENE.SRR837773.1543~~SRR837773.1543.p1  ORF type:complete len:171 (-),score=39.38 SRR837773.1543:235-747(-)
MEAPEVPAAAGAAAEVGGDTMTTELPLAEAGYPARQPQRDQLTKDSEMHLNRELVAFVLERWAAAVAAARRRRRDLAAVEAAKALAAAEREFRIVPATAAKRLTDVGRAAATARPGLARAALRMMIAGGCQAVRVGRRRVAVQRVPRAGVAAAGGRRCGPCATAGGGCRR